MSEIIPGLYIGNFAESKSLAFLTKAGITHILAVAWELPPAFPAKFTYKHINLSDKPAFPIQKHLAEAVEFISHSMSTGGRVFVHCYAGISRSSSCVIAYLMTSRKLSYAEALTLCKLSRPQVQPNKGFAAVLQVFQPPPQTPNLTMED